MTILEFNSLWTRMETEAREQMQVYPQLRYGQAIFLAAHSYFQEQINNVTGDTGEGGKDCFYNDKNIPNFWNYLFKTLVDET